MRRILSILLCVLLPVTTASCLLAETGSSSDAAKSTDVCLGDYSVVIDSCRLAADRRGEPIVIVRYLFTNNSQAPACFILSLKDSVSQNGGSLRLCHFAADSAEYSAENQSKEIRSGATLAVEIAYELNDNKAPLKVEVTELVSHSGRKVTRTLHIA